MPRTTVAQVTVPAPYSGVPHAELAFVAGDVANGNQIRLTGNQVLLAYNDSADTDYYITIASSADQFGRTKDVTQFDIPFGEYRVFSKFPVHGWAQSNGYLNVNVENAAILLAVIDLGAQPNA